MINSREELENLFAEIDRNVTSKVGIHVIGGAALLFSGLKLFTKDIDIVAPNKDDYKRLYSIFKNIGFKETALTNGIQRLSIGQTLERGDIRIDLFLEKVCKKLSLSDSMVSRSTSIFHGKNIEIKICSKEDIFLFKSITSREGDCQDCEELIRSGLDWKIILSEMNDQIAKGEPIWITYINERLDELISRGFNIPIIKEVEKESVKYYDSIGDGKAN